MEETHLLKEIETLMSESEVMYTPGIWDFDNLYPLFVIYILLPGAWGYSLRRTYTARKKFGYPLSTLSKFFYVTSIISSISLILLIYFGVNKLFGGPGALLLILLSAIIGPTCLLFGVHFHRQVS